jgi:hypothetical protein
MARLDLVIGAASDGAAEAGQIVQVQGVAGESVIGGHRHDRPRTFADVRIVLGVPVALAGAVAAGRIASKMS